MKNVVYLLSAICLLLIGCATPYQSTGFTGGYEDIQLSENIFKISFHGNGYTSRQRAEDFCLLRSAEVAKSNGYTYFVIIEDNNYSEQSSYTTPTTSYGEASVHGNTVRGKVTTYGGNTYTISKPRNSNTILCFKEKPDGISYDVNLVIPSIKAKYSIEN
jgi:hypothetical protein